MFVDCRNYEMISVNQLSRNRGKEERESSIAAVLKAFVCLRRSNRNG